MKKPTTLLIILAVLTGFAWYYNQDKTKRVNSATLVGAELRALLLPELPVNDVRKIRIREGKKQVNIVFDKNEWRVTERDNYAASFDKIHRTLLGLRELKIAGKLSVGKGALADLQLVAPGESAEGRTGLSLELLNEKGDVIASLIAGKNVETSGGASSGQFMGGPGQDRFVVTNNPKDKDTVWQVTDGFSEIQPEPQEWLDKSFLDVRKIKSAAVTMPNAADSWTALKKDENSEFILGEPKNGDELDTAKASGLSSLLSTATFTDIVPKDKANADLLKGAITAKITTFEGFDYDVKLLEKKGASESDSKALFSYTVSANINKVRTPEKDEKPEDKEKKDKEFATKVKELEDKLAKEKKAEGWVFEVSNFVVNTLTQKRSALLRDKPAAPAAPSLNLPGLPKNPANAGSAAPAETPPPAREPISVTTPPVSVDSIKPMPTAPAGAPEVKAPSPEAAKPAEEPKTKN